MALIFTDCEAYGGCPRTGQLTEFGAVEYETRKTFHGIVVPSRPSPSNPAIPEPVEEFNAEREIRIFSDFAAWLSQFKGRPVFVSDNPAFDWQWINDGFHRCLGKNPFGFSARRISDFYAGLCGNFYKTQDWKKYRKTPHDHNPVNDAMGNVEAFAALMAGKR